MGRTVLHRALFEYSNFERIWILFSEKSLIELDCLGNKIVGVGKITGDLYYQRLNGFFTDV